MWDEVIEVLLLFLVANLSQIIMNGNKNSSLNQVRRELVDFIQKFQNKQKKNYYKEKNK